jgi:HPt (histidine-containing phosphotransfer) domain-containing protein
LLVQLAAGGATRDLELAAHSLRGAGAALGAVRIEALAAQLEQACARPGAGDDLRRLAGDLHRELRALACALDDRLG